MNAATIDRIIRWDEVLQITGAARSTVYLWVKQGKFPKPRKLGPRAAGWKSSEIHDWIHSREHAA